ncbi:MAG: substrate-binding domain-containing protein [Anaerolineaceae bacterium]|nr:substrate-binding domain-containing protein [Anaerolineaceae bacterium]
MDEPYLYQRIAVEIREEILAGRLKPGERLPPVRTLMRQWNCTSGTIQRAYRTLAVEGLIISQAGKGTHVSSPVDSRRLQARAPLRRASMVHRAESFLLESLAAGYGLEEIEQSFSLALDRWRALPEEAPAAKDAHTVCFSGSHDTAVTWLAGHLGKLAPGLTIQLNFTGSLGGLMALAEGKADLAGSHLWDAQTGAYNDPFVRKLFPGKKMLLVHLARRNLGFITAPGNPLRIRSIPDLARPGMRMINRQSGSGTRVWLDTVLQQAGIKPGQIQGYTEEKATHSEVAREIAEDKADVGVGLESAARAFGLGFELLTQEEYDLVAYEAQAGEEPLATLLGLLSTEALKEQLRQLQGYDFSRMGDRRVLVL